MRVALTLVQCWHRVPGGTARAAVALAGALVARGDVEVVGVGARQADGVPPPFTPPVPVRHLPLPYQALYDVWQRTPWFGPESVTGPVDVVHVTAPTVPSRTRAPMVVTLHDVFPVLDPEVLTPRGARLMQRGIELARTRADLVCCSSTQTLEDCVALGFERDRLRLVPLGVAPPATVDAAAVAAVRSRHRLERPYVLWVGTIEPRKNLPVLLDAFRRADLGEVDLVLVGPEGWDTELAPRLEPLGDRARTLGFVADDELAALYAGAELFALPSRREGFGLPALEAMAQGTAVVGAAGTAVAEVVDDAGMLVDPADVDAWAEALSALLADPDRRAALGRAGRERAATFTWERTAELTVAAYREVLR